MTGAIAPTKPLTALDLCDRCGAQAYVRVLLPNSGELLFCAHHGREHLPALKKVAVDIQDETQRLVQAGELARAPRRSRFRRSVRDPRDCAAPVASVARGG